MNKYRILLHRLASAFDTFRVVSVTGARQVGKTTLVREFCEGRGIPLVSLDDPVVQVAAAADPDGWLAGFEGPVAIDEAQRVPELFGAIKRRVDRDRRPGQIILTGSALWLHMRNIGDTLAGRAVLLDLWPFTAAERAERTPFDFAALFSEPWPEERLRAALRTAPEHPQAIAQTVLLGGYPEPSAISDPVQRNLWFSSYLSTYLQRDVLDLARIEYADAYIRMIRILAARTGQLLNISSLARDLGLPQPTAARYAHWLSATYQRFDLPPYAANLGKRVIKTPKHYWSDTGMVAALLGWRDWADVVAAAMDGALVESWVASELRKWADYHGQKGLYFWRTHGGGEADFVVERNGRIIAIEVKTGARVDARDMKGLVECRTALGARFLRGIVLHGGNTLTPLGDGLYAVPLSLLLGAPRSGERICAADGADERG